MCVGDDKAVTAPAFYLESHIEFFEFPHQGDPCAFSQLFAVKEFDELIRGEINKASGNCSWLGIVVYFNWGILLVYVEFIGFWFITLNGDYIIA